MEKKVALAYLYTFDPKDEVQMEKQFAEIKAQNLKTYIGRIGLLLD